MRELDRIFGSKGVCDAPTKKRPRGSICPHDSNSRARSMTQWKSSHSPVTIMTEIQKRESHGERWPRVAGGVDNLRGGEEIRVKRVEGSRTVAMINSEGLRLASLPGRTKARWKIGKLHHTYESFTKSSSCTRTRHRGWISRTEEGLSDVLNPHWDKTNDTAG